MRQGQQYSPGLDALGMRQLTLARRLLPASSPAPGQINALLSALASPKWMLAFFIFAAISAVISMEHPEWITPVWMLPLGIFCLSLLAAMATNPRLRGDLPLLGLHLGLFALIVLFAAARLTYLDGHVSLERGQSFSGKLDIAEQGPWHFGKLPQLRFANDGFEETFRPGERWEVTANRIYWWNDAGQRQSASIGESRPLLLSGYRIYTTFNRGFSVHFQWENAAGEVELGNVQLRPGEHDLANEWLLPNGIKVWAMLQPQESLQILPGESRRNLGVGTLGHRLVIRHGEQRHVIARGESLDLPGGRLTYRKLDTWMGYRLVFDPTIHWLGAAGLFSVLCMVVYYGRLFIRKRAT